MSTLQPFSRRQFLKQSFAFSAASALAGSLIACGSGSDSLLPPSPEAVHLLMLGDWGIRGDYSEQTAVAQAMKDYAKQQSANIEALLMLGDNFYGDLTGGVADPRWQTQFEQMYPSSVFNCPAYAIPGNHDYQNQPLKYTEELAYAQQGGTRWTMPAQWYRVTFPTNEPVITFLALDSNMPFAGGSTQSGGFYSMTEEARQAQLSWLESELEKPLTTPFLAVMGHHPIYSDGPHGDNATLINDWDPLLRRYGVHLYLAGHDYDLQHLEFTKHPTSFFLSGGGGADLYTLKTDPTVRGPWAQKVHGFSHIEATESLLTLRHLDGTGKVIHAFTKSRAGVVTILS
ncbi:MAG TPA: metallophosphoesterase [Edaphobacter sp.]|nr:metallophosphoesterase [Edaphobacter sp.]